MWENIIMKPLKIKEITPDKLIELEQEAQEVRLIDLTARQLENLSDQRQISIMNLNDVELDCQLRAIRAHQAGFSKAELARIFKVNSNTIKKWVG